MTISMAKALIAERSQKSRGWMGSWRVCPILSVLVLSLLFATTGEAARSWKAGAARVKITPRQPMLLSGKKQRQQPATETLHDLWAKALVLEYPAGDRVALVTLDLVGIDCVLSDAVRDALKAKYHLQRQQVALCAYHTHNGPVVGSNLALMFSIDEVQQTHIDHYATALKTKMVTVVGDTIGRLAPCRLAWGTGHAKFAINRVTTTEAELESLLQGGNAQGPVDHDVPVLSITDRSDRLQAIVFGYACHPIWLRHFSIWSGDYPGVAQSRIERSHPGAVAMFCAGCGGDQNPLSAGGRLQRSEGKHALLPDSFQSAAIQEVEDIGGQLAQAVETVIAGEMTPVVGELTASYQEIDLPFDTLPTREQLQREAASSNKYRARWAQSLLNRIDGGQPLGQSYPYPVQVWRLGSDLLFVTLGGEVTVDYALRLKQELGPSTTWVAAYANDVMAYIPSRRVQLRGGYEAGGAMIYYGLPVPWAPQIKDIIVDSVARQANPLPDGTSRKPDVNSEAATAVGITGMTLNGSVHPHGLPTRYHFEFGPIEDYGSRTEETALPPRLAAYYREDWDDGYGGWGERNGPIPQHAEGGVNGGFVRYTSPTSDDHNHDDGIGTLHLSSYLYTGPLSTQPDRYPSAYLSSGDPDLRGARISVYVRGRDWVPNGSELIWWTQSQSNLEVGTKLGYRRANWAYTGFMLTDLLRSGEWEKAEYRLRHNSHQWSFGGYYIKKPDLDDLITPEQRAPYFRYPYWPIDQSQRHVNYDFFHLLAFVDPQKAPQGAIDFDEFQLVYRNESLVFPSNGGRLVASPASDADPSNLTDGWRHGMNRTWRSEENPDGPLKFVYEFDNLVTINAIQLHQNPNWPAKEVECLVSSDGKTYSSISRSTLPEKGTPNANFAFTLKTGLSAKAKSLKVQIMSGYQTKHWGLGEIEVFGTGALMQTDDELYEVNIDIMKLHPGTTYHYRLVAVNSAGTSYGDDRTFTVPRDATPRVRTSVASRVTSTTAKIEGRVNPIGHKSTFYFEYGTDASYGEKSPAVYCGRQLVPRTVFVNLAGLKSDTRYHYRLVAQNDVGKSYGADATFQTPRDD